MGIVTGTDTTNTEKNQTTDNNGTTNTEPTFEQIQNQIQELSDNPQEIHRTADQIKEQMRAGTSHETLFSDKAALIQAARDHGHTINEIYGGTPPSKPELDIQNITQGMYSVRIEATVTQVQTKNTFSGGQVRSIIIKDDTGRTQVTAWDDDTAVWYQFEEGDRIIVKDGYTNQEISDYQQDRFGVPAIQLGDDAVVARDTGEGWDEYEL